MRNNEEISLGKALNDAFSSFNLANEVQEQRVQNALNNLFGKVLNNQLSRIQLKGKILTLYIISSPLRHELFLNRTKIKERLNEELGEVIIDQIILK